MKRTRSSVVVAAGLAILFAWAPSSSAASPKHVIYLHGGIIQETQSARPRHPRFGYYELEEILDAFRKRGFDVRGEIRPKPASVSESADLIVAQVRQLLDSGVAAENVTIVGGSMGAAIALLAATRLQQPELRFGVLGACLSATVSALEASEGQTPAGHILSIREKSDDFTEPCPAWDGRGEALSVREMVLETGLAHGFLYRPLQEWMEPVAEWAGAAGAVER